MSSERGERNSSNSQWHTSIWKATGSAIEQTGRLVKSKLRPRHFAASIHTTHLVRLETEGWEVNGSSGSCLIGLQHEATLFGVFEQQSSDLLEQQERAAPFAADFLIKALDSLWSSLPLRMAYEGGSIPCSAAQAKRSFGVLQQQFVQQVFASRQPQVPPWHG